MKYLNLFENFFSNIANDDTDDDLMYKLNKYDVPLDIWGTKGYKTLDHLKDEIEEGETILTEENGELVRRVVFVGGRVIYKKDGVNYRLYESKQVFKDGRVRKRNLPYSIAEKFKSGENHEDSIIRGMEEELGVKVNKNQFAFYNKVEIENNADYPGIRSYHTGYEYLVILNENQYNKEGYIERQKDKDVYFEWRIINSVKESLSDSNRLDEILDKISLFGYDKLTDEEKMYLDAESEEDIDTIDKLNDIKHQREDREDRYKSFMEYDPREDDEMKDIMKDVNLNGIPKFNDWLDSMSQKKK